MRLAFLAVIITLFALPLMAKTVDNARLPGMIEDQLNQAATTGDHAVVKAEAQRLAMTYPNLKNKISSYVSQIVSPAADVVAAVNEMTNTMTDDSSAGTPDDVTAMAEALNNIDVGAGQ